MMGERSDTDHPTTQPNQANLLPPWPPCPVACGAPKNPLTSTVTSFMITNNANSHHAPRAHPLRPQGHHRPHCDPRSPPHRGSGPRRNRHRPRPRLPRTPPVPLAGRHPAREPYALVARREPYALVAPCTSASAPRPAAPARCRMPGIAVAGLPGRPVAGLPGRPLPYPPAKPISNPPRRHPAEVFSPA